MKPKIFKRMPKKAQRLAAIKALRGILRPTVGDAAAPDAWAKIRAEDRAIEERHEAALCSVGDKRRGRAKRGS